MALHRLPYPSVRIALAVALGLVHWSLVAFGNRHLLLEGFPYASCKQSPSVPFRLETGTISSKRCLTIVPITGDTAACSVDKGITGDGSGCCASFKKYGLKKLWLKTALPACAQSVRRVKLLHGLVEQDIGTAIYDTKGPSSIGILKLSKLHLPAEALLEPRLLCLETGGAEPPCSWEELCGGSECEYALFTDGNSCCPTRRAPASSTPAQPPQKPTPSPQAESLPDGSAETDEELERDIEEEPERELDGDGGYSAPPSDSAAPSDQPRPTISHAVKIAAGAEHACALLAGYGGVACWGVDYGGNWTADDSFIRHNASFWAPTHLDLGEEQAVDIGCSVGTVCVVFKSGRLRCWTLGLRTGYDMSQDWDDEYDTTFFDQGGNYHQVPAVHNEGIPLIEQSGRGEGEGVARWHGASGYEIKLPPERKAVAVSSGGSQAVHMCVVFDDGSLRCWVVVGWGRSPGLLGTGDFLPYKYYDVADMPGARLGSSVTGVRAVTTGWDHTCVATEPDGEVKCFGKATRGALGMGLIPQDIVGAEYYGRGWGAVPRHMGDGLIPATLPGGAGAVAVAAGHDFSCAILTTGKVACWGDWGDSKLGIWNATIEPGSGRESGKCDCQTRPTLLALGSADKAVSISLGSHHGCMALDDGSVRCFGGDFRSGVLGYQSELFTTMLCTTRSSGDRGFIRCVDTGNTDFLYSSTFAGEEPAQGSYEDFGSVPLPRKARQVAVGRELSCALLEGGVVACWPRWIGAEAWDVEVHDYGARYV